MIRKEGICPYCGSSSVESDNIAYFVDNTFITECYCCSCNEFFDETHNINSSEIVDGAFMWCVFELDAKVKAEHSKKWAKKLQKVRENESLVKSVGYEALRQWEDLIMPSFVEGLWYPKKEETESFNKEKYIESKVFSDASDYVLKMMRDFIETTKFDKDLSDYDGEFVYNDTPLQY